MDVRLSDRAIRELDDILQWYEIVAEPLVAAIMEDRFWDTFRRIADGLLVGMRRPLWLPDPYRFVLMDPYWIIWRPERRSRLVVAVLHSRRDIPRLLIGLR